MSDTFDMQENLPRILTIGAAFATVTLALILLQPSGESTADNTAAPEPDAVTRAQTDVLGLTEDSTSLLRNGAVVGKSETPANIGAKPETKAALVVDAESQAPAVDDLTATVLASLQAGASQPDAATTATTASAATAATPEDDVLRSLTSSVLSGLKSNSADSASSMERLVVQALKQGQSDSYIEAMINAAADAGDIVVPSALRTGEGNVDTGTLLAELVRKSDPDAEQPAPVSHQEGVEVRVVQRANETRHYNFYTVQPGDSLGAIAHRIYGDAAFYKVIFEANKKFLSRPDKIRVGLRLTIPELETSG
ncbi:LysM peptidoglycan-binding domain-containing protein [Lentibacter algarum]|uniref:LysM peptidoglycan-binding domain-containing protein n=1 Tax=Lentibacter algarum TaxID=576131 RepID=UPI001C078422|nr:LysM peptidoglycan-binding domain-containing protein [Lentibacter algarum]MBU2981543.1 LysM peptidoglycan-binding domain-containing protein [Lentibacter algarum]